MNRPIITNHIARAAGETVLKRIRALKAGQKMQDLPEELWHDSFRYYVKEDPTRVGGPNLRLIRLDSSKPSLTVTGFIFNKFVHPTEDRFITPREAARLQGFPDDFIFEGPLTSIQRQVGNAVPVQLAEALSNCILDHIRQYRPFGLTKTLYKRKALPVLSLFSGAGGLDLGFSRNNTGSPHWKIGICIDDDHDSCLTLKKNFKNNILVLEQDISQIKPESLLSNNTLKLENQILPLIIGGPPCQSFSQAGRQKGIEDPRGQLIYEFLRFVEILKPIYFVLENVSNLKSIDKGAFLADIVERSKRIGYNVRYRLLCATDFGAPQFRRRLFIIGTRLPTPPISFPTPTHADNQLLDLKPFSTVSEAFSNLPQAIMNGNTRPKPTKLAQHKKKEQVPKQ